MSRLSSTHTKPKKMRHMPSHLAPAAPQRQANKVLRKLPTTRQMGQRQRHHLLDMQPRRKTRRPLDCRPHLPRRRLDPSRSPQVMQLQPRQTEADRLTPPPSPPGVPLSWAALARNDPKPCATRAWSVEGCWLEWSHGHTINGSRSREQSATNRAEAFEGFAHSERFGCATDARHGVGCGRSVGGAVGAGRLGRGWVKVLVDVLDGWSSSSVGAARHSAHDQVVFQLRQDRRVGSLVGRRGRAQVVHESERSDRDASSGEADRADGCSEHGLDVVVGFHTVGSGKVGSSGDKGGK